METAAAANGRRSARRSDLQISQPRLTSSPVTRVFNPTTVMPPWAINPRIRLVTNAAMNPSAGPASMPASTVRFTW